MDTPVLAAIQPCTSPAVASPPPPAAGVPTGIFQADEHLAGTMPSHGTETCTVVEASWSLNVVFSVQGDASFADRAERITYNGACR